MTLDELNNLKKQADEDRRAAAAAKNLSAELAAIRNGEKPLMVAYKGLGSWNEHLKSAIEGIINECGSDLLRIAEMRLESQARHKSVQSRQKLAALEAALGGNHDSQ